MELEKKSVKLLIASGKLAKERTKSNKYYLKKGIKYELPESEDLVELFKKETPLLWEKWLALVENYLESGEESNLRPTIDRIDAEKNYSLDNIDFITFIENVRKDKAVKITVYDFERMTINEYFSMYEFANKIACSRELVSRYCNSGVLLKARYLIQAENGRKEDRNNLVEKTTNYRCQFSENISLLNEEGTQLNKLNLVNDLIIEVPKILMVRQTAPYINSK